MAIVSKIIENKLKGKTTNADCSECRRSTSHVILSSITEKGEDILSDNIGIDWHNEYQIIQCEGCKSITFRETNFFSEDVCGNEDPTKVFLYPKRTIKEKKEIDTTNFPLEVSNIYIETISTYNDGSLILCAAGLRAIVEATCKVLKINGTNASNKKGGSYFKNNLEGKIDGLVENGYLTQSSAKMLHKHRLLGNEALHEIKHPKKEHLLTAIEIIEHFLSHIFDLPTMAQSMA
ncbi:protein of unknown function [Arachidicoccus rhizosphaerae]|uniref:DUF4145 domain-containing protein n=1 Tax=Arachidicoccus rhizosphaerae TaxID=551991 RepID=A0A1H3YRT1_9BACT|nr:DUF4145 domain-containing protein [Arachidicoccus rhizosphaerae]SEA14245.1 protein of unknown function [Arachidicoccus rhizosphaerae]